MKVLITGTPEIKQEFIDNVVNYLNSFGDSIHFEKTFQMDYHKLEFANKKFKYKEKVQNLSFTEFFNLIEYYRTLIQVDGANYIILLTNISNNKEWYSAFREKNIFINCSEWTSILGNKLEFGIAYQCIENIFQSLIKLDINKYLSEPNIHLQPIGCMNDYCEDESQILFKLRTGDICKSCLDRAIENNVPQFVLNQIIKTCEKVRSEFVATSAVKQNVNPEVIRIDNDGTVYVGDKKLKLEVIYKVILIFFLKHPEGIQTKLLSNHEKELFDIYKELRKGGDETVIKNMFGVSKENDVPLFEQKRSKLKKALKEQLPDPLYNHYTVKTIRQPNDINLYKIDLEKKYINIDPRF